MLTVIVINDFAHVNGGAAQVAITSAIALAKNEHRVVLFSAVAPIPEELELSDVEVVITNQQEIAKDNSRLRAVVQGLWNVKARRMLRSLLDSCDPARTVVHLHGWSVALSSSVVRECWDRGFKIVATLHDYFTACPNGGFFNYRTQEICALKPLSWSCVKENCDSRSYLQKHWRTVRQLIQIKAGGIPEFIKAFIVVSDFSRQILEPFLPQGAPIHLVKNPIDIGRAPKAIIEEKAPFIYVGRLSPHKGIALLACASTQVTQQTLFVGEGRSRADIERIAPAARIGGWLPKNRVYEELSKARTLVFPSLWYETQGLVVTEAAAMGIPSIVADTSAARELVEDGVTGYWFTGGNSGALVEKMRALEDTATARRMGEAAYERCWNTCFTIEMHVRELEECYSQLLKAA
jgi:glycosyltransferase involved in cell wall biosynthesis